MKRIIFVFALTAALYPLLGEDLLDSPGPEYRRMRGDIPSGDTNVSGSVFVETHTVAPLPLAISTPEIDFVGLAQDTRKLSDVGTDFELLIVTLARAPELRITGFPSTISVIFFVRKPKNSEDRLFSLPDGSELKVHLVRRPDGTYETIYYRDETQSPKLSRF